MNDNPLVYSTDKGRISSKKNDSEQIPEGDGVVRIKRETKGRKGKGVTTISGILLKGSELKSLTKELKQACGTGGALKDGVIEIQGDNREKIKSLLEARGFKVKFAGG